VKPSLAGVHVRLVVATFFWALTPVFGRMLAEYSAPYALTFGRFLVATGFLWGFLRLTGASTRLPVADLGTIALLGLTGVCLHNVLTFMGMEHSEANRANVVFSTITIMIALIDLVWFRRRLGVGAMAGILLGILGTAWVVSDGAPARLLAGVVGLGDALILASAASWAFYSVLGRPLLARYSPLALTYYASLAGTLMLLPFVLFDRAAIPALFADPRALPIVVFLGVLNSAVGFLWYYQAVARLGAVIPSAYINLVPIFGVVMAALLLGERPSASLLGGGAMVLLALYFINRHSADGARPASPAPDTPLRNIDPAARHPGR
jgi:drug/metabolite transporter (DMT)-like permease